MVYAANLSGSEAFISGFGGRSGSSSVAAVNDAGEFGFLPGEDAPYMPIGGRKAIAAVIDVLEFKAYEFGSHVTVKRGRKF